MNPEILPPFPGFRSQAFQFLRDLATNNERDWFKPRKDTFDDELMWPLRCLVADLSRRMRGAGLPLSGNPSKSVFRIYRDVRFSKNKEPYKRHVAGVLSRSGSKKEPGGLYIHIEPGNCFTAAGFWQPPTEILRTWRHRIASAPESFIPLLSDLNEKGYELVEYGMLKRSPRGFGDVADPAIAALLLHKSFLVQRNYTEQELASPDFADQVVHFALEASALLRFGWHVQDAASKPE